MKLSNKILVITAGLVMAGIITGLIVARNFALQWIRNTEVKSGYKTIAVGNFEYIDFSNNWNVRIKQGNEYKVELAIEGGSELKPKLENINGTLYFKVDRLDSMQNYGSINARITTPFLKGIKAGLRTKINLENFQSDSLRILLEDGGAYIGYNNIIKYVTVKTSGEVVLKLTDEGDVIR